VYLALTFVTLEHYAVQLVSSHVGFQDLVGLLASVIWRNLGSAFRTAETAFSLDFRQVDSEEPTGLQFAVLQFSVVHHKSKSFVEQSSNGNVSLFAAFP
jgi:hypothetical protein